MTDTSLRARFASDRGFTLPEVLVSMVVFAVVISISSLAIVMLARASTDAKTRSQSSSEALVAFQVIDRQVRYSSSINYPGIGSSGASYVEFITPRASRPPKDDGSDPAYDLCTQWRYIPASGTLQMRQWESKPSPSLPLKWQTKATLVQTAASTTYPFELVPASAGGATKQSLRIQIEAGGTRESGRTSIDTTLIARNSSLTSQSNTDANGDGRSDNPVCQPTGARP